MCVCSRCVSVCVCVGVGRRMQTFMCSLKALQEDSIITLRVCGSVCYPV